MRMQDTSHHRVTSLSQALPGWNDYWQVLFEKYKGPYLPGRVCTVQKTRYEVIIPGDIISVPISGVLKTKQIFPVVGDFVVILHQPQSGADMIVALLPRKTVLSRGGAGDYAGQQNLAANVDTVCIVTEPGPDLSLPRIERYLLIIRKSGANPIIILNKSDTCIDIPKQIQEIKSEIRDIPVIPLSAANKTGLEHLLPYLSEGKTIALLGSSGVGKSTLINSLYGSEIQKTGDIRDDDGKGRHTTTVRHLVSLPGGCSLIDTPGLREIRIWTAEESISEVFDDIHQLAGQCRFSDCTHDQEPGCAVREAVVQGELSAFRLERYQKILKEVAFEHDKAAIGLKRFEKKRYREISKTIKAIYGGENFKRG